jgi:hypothetical protein
LLTLLINGSGQLEIPNCQYAKRKRPWAAGHRTTSYAQAAESSPKVSIIDGGFLEMSIIAKGLGWRLRGFLKGELSMRLFCHEGQNMLYLLITLLRNGS